MKILSEKFCEAATDYLYLLNRNFPQKALIKIIGDRYQLSGTERSMLYRGICSSKLAHSRNEKLAGPDTLNSKWIYIDTYNVLITIGSYLNGNTVFISNDSILRDASEMHGKVFRTELINRALSMVFEFLIHYEPTGLSFLIDSPVCHSGKLCAGINQLMSEMNLKGSAEIHNSPDFVLKNTREGIIATSDSSIIDSLLLPVIDLPQHVLRYHFDPEFFDLRGFRSPEAGQDSDKGNQS